LSAAAVINAYLFIIVIVGTGKEDDYRKTTQMAAATGLI